MCFPALALVPAAVSSLAAAGSTAAGAAGTFLGISGATWGTIGTVAGLASTGIGAISSMAQGQQQANIAKANAKLAREREVDALRRGSREEGEQRQRYQNVIGQQRAAMGASGVVVDELSGGDILAQTAEFGERDAQRIRVNAAREAWGYAGERAIYKSQASQARTAGLFQAGSTLLTGTTDILRQSPWWKRQWGSKSVPEYEEY